jgi:hypothetical protein
LVVGWEDVAHRWEADSGLMQGHSRLEFEVSRVFNLAQSVPCLLVKAENLVYGQSSHSQRHLQ